MRLSWDFAAGEHDLEDDLAKEPLDAQALEHKASYDELIRKANAESSQCLPPLSDVSFAIAANAIGNEGMLFLAPRAPGKACC